MNKELFETIANAHCREAIANAMKRFESEPNIDLSVSGILRMVSRSVDSYDESPSEVVRALVEDAVADLSYALYAASLIAVYSVTKGYEWTVKDETLGR